MQWTTSFSLSSSKKHQGGNFLNLNNRFCSTTCWEKKVQSFQFARFDEPPQDQPLGSFGCRTKSGWTFALVLCFLKRYRMLWRVQRSTLNSVLDVCTLFVVYPYCSMHYASGVAREVPCKVVIGMLRWMVLELIGPMLGVIGVIDWPEHTWDLCQVAFYYCYSENDPIDYTIIYISIYIIFFKSVESSA